MENNNRGNKKMNTIKNLKFFVFAVFCALFGQSRGELDTGMKLLLFGTGAVIGGTMYHKKGPKPSYGKLATGGVALGSGLIPLLAEKALSGGSAYKDPITGFIYSANASSKSISNNKFFGICTDNLKKIFIENPKKTALAVTAILAAPTLGNYVQFRDSKLTAEGRRLKVDQTDEYGKFMHQLSSYWCDDYIGYKGDEKVADLLKRVRDSNNELLIAIPVLNGNDVQIYTPVNINAVNGAHPVIANDSLHADDIRLVEVSNTVEQPNLAALYETYTFTGEQLLAKVQAGDKKVLRNRMIKYTKQALYNDCLEKMKTAYPNEGGTGLVHAKIIEIEKTAFNDEIGRNKILSDGMTEQVLKEAELNIKALIQKKVEYEEEEVKNKESFENKRFVVYQNNLDASLAPFKQKIVNLSGKVEFVPQVADVENAIPDTQAAIKSNATIQAKLKGRGTGGKILDALNSVFACAMGAKVEKGANYISNNSKEAAVLLNNLIATKDDKGNVKNNLDLDTMKDKGVGSLIKDNTYKWSIGRVASVGTVYFLTFLGLGAYYKSKK